MFVISQEDFATFLDFFVLISLVTKTNFHDWQSLAFIQKTNKFLNLIGKNITMSRAFIIIIGNIYLDALMPTIHYITAENFLFSFLDLAF